MMARLDPGHDGLGGRADDVYEALLAAHAGLSEVESAALNARLILLLCNAVGDPGAVLAVIAGAGKARALD
jgi:hypothetical protein